MCQPGRPAPQGLSQTRLPGLGRLPQREVQRAALARVHVDSSAGAQIVEVAPRERAVVREAPHLEVDVAALLVGVPGGDDLLDQRHDLLDVAADRWLHVGFDVAQRGHVVVEGLDEARRERQRILAALGGAVDDLVVHVGEVADVAHLVASCTQVADHDVEGHVAARVAHVAVVIDRGPADVDPDLPLLVGSKLDLVPLRCVVEPDHGVASSGLGWSSRGCAGAGPGSRR